ncbi:hypothetical protein YPPY01_4679, partial [Yersinia pestis PY-01]
MASNDDVVLVDRDRLGKTA